MRTTILIAALLVALELAAAASSQSEVLCSSLLPTGEETTAPFLSVFPDQQAASSEARMLLPPYPLRSPAGRPLREPDENWVEATLARMTLDDKLGQMIMPSYSASTADSMVTTYRVGGFIFLGNSNIASDLHAATTHLQGITSVPLIFAIDCEAGLGARVTNATRMPLNMAVGASQRKDLARLAGRITARECRSIGIHIGFGPVLDVNTEPVNPIIGVRSYGDSPQLVAKMAEAYVEGARSEGLLCTFKHFPGHGATTGDSHNSLPVVSIPCDELEANHVFPYRELLGRGLGDLVMSAHVWYECLDPGSTAWPATLSANALTGILRTELGYQGAVISDSFGMAGLLQAANTYDAARIGVQAGLDIILMPTSVSDAIAGLRDAVQGGQIPQARIDQAVRRILRLKSRVGMPEETTVPASRMTATIGHPDHLAIAAALARSAICTARVQPGEFPIQPQHKVLCLSLDASSSIFYLYSGSFFMNAFAELHANVTTQTVSTSISASQRAAIVSNSANFDRIVVISRDWKPTISSAQVALVQALLDAGRCVAYCSFGSPYHINQWPNLRNFYSGFSSHYETQREMARVLLGLSQPQGTWPVVQPDGLPPAPWREQIPTASSVTEWDAYVEKARGWEMGSRRE